MVIHESAEDYLESILILQEQCGQVRSIDIVNKLGYSKPSVSIAILKAEAEKQAAILRADGEAQAILAVQKALADSLELLNEKAPNDQVIKLKAIEAMQKVADGKSTKLIIPSEMQGLVGLASGIAEAVKKD